MSKKLTPWFAGDIKPSRKGVYERDDSKTEFADGEPSYSYWDGGRWYSLSAYIDSAARTTDWPSRFQSLPWRGLAERPK